MVCSCVPNLSVPVGSTRPTAVRGQDQYDSIDSAVPSLQNTDGQLMGEARYLVWFLLPVVFSPGPLAAIILSGAKDSHVDLSIGLKARAQVHGAHDARRRAVAPRITGHAQRSYRRWAR